MKHLKKFNEGLKGIDPLVISIGVIWLIQGKFSPKNMVNNIDAMLKDFCTFATNYGYEINYDLSKVMFNDIILRASDKLNRIRK